MGGGEPEKPGRVKRPRPAKRKKQARILTIDDLQPALKITDPGAQDILRKLGVHAPIVKPRALGKTASKPIIQRMLERFRHGR
jgi:hypothetical protein